jgi:HlyD family secretion protein
MAQDLQAAPVSPRDNLTRDGSGRHRGWSWAFWRKSQDEAPQELLDFYSPSQAVMVTKPYSLAHRTTALIGTMALALIFIFVTVNTDRVVTGQGKIISVANPVVVAPFMTALVKTIAVAEGDIVRKGQLLAQLDPTYAAADNKAAQEQVDRYQTQIDRLTAELHQQPYRPAALTPGALTQIGIYEQRKAAHDAEIRYYQGQIDAQSALMAQAYANIRQYAKETGVAVDVEKMREALERDQVGSRLDTLAAISARLEMERQVLGSIQQMENAKQTIASLQGQLDNYNQQWFADASQLLTDTSVQLANYRNQLEHAQLNYKLMDLRAEEDSIVLTVAKVSPGAVLQTGQTFFELVPLNAPLEADVQVLGDESGFVRTGQPVSIKFQTFPYSRFGLAHGTVRMISADAFLTATGASAMSPTATGGVQATSAQTTPDAIFTGSIPTSPYYYDMRVTLDRVKLHNMPKDFHVVPGMPIEADVKVGNRTIFDYLIERVAPIFSEGMREPS